MSKITTPQKAIEIIESGSVLMIGGFLKGGHPETLVRELATKKQISDLTVISNDTGTTECSLYNVIKNKQVKKVIASYIGANPETGKGLITGEMEVELLPQGTLAEKIRAGGAGLGGFLTPVGVGTIVEEGKEKITIDQKEYILELPLKADIALVRAAKADENGNLVFKGSSRNFNAIMPLAAEHVIAEVEEIVPIGEIDPNEVDVPGILIDKIVKVGE
ncbi:CoA transferase subunit A [Clostridium sp. C2-6-12]|uniref:CoA transferase subunit A n=1 Tax=Clostridium sp. C2-6-12 TaxID=2698832 RepID=UPI001920F217|nr:CoA transferase subunit A [Clostridium sp. C2-6-12]